MRTMILRQSAFWFMKKCKNIDSARTLSLSQWNVIISSGWIIEFQIDTKITISDDVHQKNIPAKFASIRPWSFSEEEWRWMECDDNSPHGQTMPAEKKYPLKAK